MPAESRWLAIRDALKDALEVMARKRGYHYDYAEVITGAGPVWDAEPDDLRPRVCLLWDGEVEQDGIAGGELAAGRYRHWDRWLIGVVIQTTSGEDGELVANRVRQDIHRAILSGNNRALGLSRTAAFDAGCSWQPAYEPGDPKGGLLVLTYHVRWDHVTGDMTTQ